MKNLSFMRPNECDFGENFKDYYVEIGSIKKGEIFFECSRGWNHQLKATEDAKKEEDGWYCKVETSNKTVVEIYVSNNTSYSGTNFFRAPQYLTCEEKLGSVYIIK